MINVEFQAKVENGVIVVPQEYQHELAEASTVKIVVFKQPKKQSMQFDIMDELKSLKLASLWRSLLVKPFQALACCYL